MAPIVTVNAQTFSIIDSIPRINWKCCDQSFGGKAAYVSEANSIKTLPCLEHGSG